MLTLFHCKTSYASQIVRLFFAVRKISWESHLVDLRTQKHITSDYRKINPNGTVPALRDSNNNKTICNSTEIMIYVGKEYVTPKIPEDSAATIINFCKEQENFHDPHLRILSYKKLFMSNRQQNKDDIERVTYLSHKHPNEARGKFLERAVKGEFSQEEIEIATIAVEQFLERMNTLLSNNNHSKYLFGTSTTSNYSMADASATAALFRIERIGMMGSIQKFSKVYRYYQEMKEEDCFIKADMC